MPEIPVQHIVSVSTEDKRYPAENLIKSDSFKKWKCASAGEKQAIVKLQFEKATEIAQIDIGNDGSAFVEVLVGKSTSKADDDYQVILVTSSFMTPQESRTSQNLNKVRIFGTEALSKAVIGQKWDRAMIICSQPFNKNLQYGLSFIKFHSTPANESEATAPNESSKSVVSLGAFSLKKNDLGDDSSAIQTGSLFARSRQKSETLPLSGAAAIRDASRAAAAAEVVQSAIPSHLPVSSQAHTGQSQTKVKRNDTSLRDLTPSSSQSTSRIEPEVKPQRQTQQTGTQPPPPKKAKSSSSTVKERPFERLMYRVRFVVSGIENPLRGHLREMGMEMGAVYKPDWDNHCTHLICAFENTPKYQLVKGKGRIVTKDWILDCYKKKKLLPWRSYRLGKAPSPPPTESESSDEEDQLRTNRKIAAKEATKIKMTTAVASTSQASSGNHISATEQRADVIKHGNAAGVRNVAVDLFDASTDEDEPNDPKPSTSHDKPVDRPKLVAKQDDKKNVTRNTDIFNASTDEEDDADTKATACTTSAKTDKPCGSGDDLPWLPNFFEGMMFFLYGSFSTAERRTIIRYIMAYGGVIEDYMNEKVNFVVSSGDWDKHFDEALAENARLVFVRPDWINACHDQQSRIPHQKYLIER